MTTSPTIAPTQLGQEDESCAECGAALATDQRYCLNCGRRRTGPRIPYERHLLADAPSSSPVAAGAVAGDAPGERPRRELSPLLAATALAALGVMLLIGVLIGKGDSPEQAAAPPAVVNVGDAGAGSEQASTDPSAASKKSKKASGKGSGKPANEVSNLTGAGAKQGETVTASKGALEDLENTTGEDYQNSIEKLPDKIATPGKLPQQDPGGQAGGGSGAEVIK